MSFADKVHALRALFKVPEDVMLPQAVCGMSQSMGLLRAARRPCVPNRRWCKRLGVEC